MYLLIQLIFLYLFLMYLLSHLMLRLLYRVVPSLQLHFQQIIHHLPVVSYSVDQQLMQLHHLLMKIQVSLLLLVLSYQEKSDLHHQELHIKHLHHHSTDQHHLYIELMQPSSEEHHYLMSMPRYLMYEYFQKNLLMVQIL